MRQLKYIVLLLMSFILVACQPNKQTHNVLQPNTTTSSNHKATSNTPSEHTDNDNTKLNKLKNTSHFSPNALKHIFVGEINARQQAVGYHYEGYSKAKAKIIKSTRSKKDKNGVYRAKITIDGIEKNAYSTFFPTKLSLQEVVDTINEAYNNREHQTGNVYNGNTKSGITVQMYINEHNKIISAFPLYNK